MKSKKVLLAVLTVFFLFGCTSNTKKENANKDEKNTADVFQQNANTQTQGSFKNGFTDAEKNPDFSYTYDGNAVSIPYYVLNDFNKSQTIGIVVFVNGIPQKYVTADHTTASYMQQWTLKPNEKININAQFTPTVGVSGDKVGVYMGMVFRPNYKASKQKPGYGNNGNINFNTPTSLSYTTSVASPFPYISQDLTSTQDYKNPDASPDGSTTGMIMDWNLPNKNTTIFHTVDSKYNISFNMKGGSSTHYKVFAFVDNKPVKMNGNDYLSVSMKEGKMLRYDFKLDAKTMPKTSTLFLTAIPDGNDYMQDTADTCQSSSILLSNSAK